MSTLQCQWCSVGLVASQVHLEVPVLHQEQEELPSADGVPSAAQVVVQVVVPQLPAGTN